MKFLIYAVSIFATTVILFVLFASKEDALLYRLGSMIIGHAPESGDGAFQYPLGWLIGIGLGVVGGGVLGYVLIEYAQMPAQLAKLFKS